MDKNARSIYKTARLAAGFEQKTASTKLFCEDSTLRAYERGNRTPPDDMVAKMMVVYNAKWLGYLHLRASPIGQIVLPEINLRRGLASSVLTLNRTVNDVVKAMAELMDIAENDEVNGSEEAYQKVCTQIEANVSASMAILVNEYKKKNGSAGTHTVQGEK